MKQQDPRFHIRGNTDSPFCHLLKEIFRILKTFLIPCKYTAFDALFCFDRTISRGKLKSVYRDPLFLCCIDKFQNRIITILLQLRIIHRGTKIPQRITWKHRRFSGQIRITLYNVAHLRSCDQKEVNVSAVHTISAMRFPVVTLLTSHIKIAFICIVIKISDSLFCLLVQLNIKRNMFIQRIGFFRIISHGVFRAHIHKFLRLIELPALFAETVKTIVRRDLTRMDPTMVAVLHISQIHNVCMNLCALGIINTNTERFFLHFHTQKFTLDHCFFRPVSQFCFCRPDTFPIIFHKIIHPVFPCSCHQTI